MCESIKEMYHFGDLAHVSNGQKQKSAFLQNWQIQHAWNFGSVCLIFPK